MSSILFSIVIPTLNEEENIANLLESIANQTCKSFEVIINDSGSKDKTKELVNLYASRLPKLTFIEHKTQNVSTARNHGASLASYEWLVFFDADVTMEPAFLQKMTDHI
ncbi:glycosyl transferase, partial [Candidatus Roizmanbacteria bacterium CG_4_10_14_0_8_um_filter_39_9]